MSTSMGTDQTKQLSSLTWIHNIYKSSPQLRFRYILITNSMVPQQTKQLLSLIWVQAICESSPRLADPYVKQHGSRSDQTIVRPDLGPNYYKSSLSNSCHLHPYVKQYGSGSDQTIVKPDLGPNYLQKFPSTSSVISLCQTVWVQIRHNNCQA